MAGGSYPGDKKVTATADDKCYTLQDAYAMDGWAVPDDVDIYYVTPTSQSWSLGDREITCVFGNTDEKASLPGSLRKDATTLDSDQVAYLKAAHVLNEALDTAPDAEYVEDDLPGHKAWAGRVSTALTEQADLLDGHDWPADLRKPVAALVKDLRQGAEGVGEGGEGLRRRRVLRALRQGRRPDRPPEVGHRPQGSGARHDPSRRTTRTTVARDGERGRRTAAWRCDGSYSGEKVPG
jgi:hypothetical protein